MIWTLSHTQFHFCFLSRLFPSVPFCLGVYQFPFACFLSIHTHTHIHSSIPSFTSRFLPISKSRFTGSDYHYVVNLSNHFLLLIPFSFFHTYPDSAVFFFSILISHSYPSISLCTTQSHAHLYSPPRTHSSLNSDLLRVQDAFSFLPFLVTPLPHIFHATRYFFWLIRSRKMISDDDDDDDDELKMCFILLHAEVVVLGS